MVYCDSIVENNSIFLENLNKNASSNWSALSSDYSLYLFYYTKKLIKDHIYYVRCKYKFTTTNQSPTWCGIYLQGGWTSTTAIVNNPLANTEYTISGYGVMQSGGGITLEQGHVYNGNSNAINGVKAQVKEFVVYDVTSLKTALLASGQITNSSDTLVAWCDNNLEYKPTGVSYDVTSLVNNSSKINMYTGNIHCTPIECDGMEVYSCSDRLRNNTYFDTGNSVYVYNNKGNGTVVHERIDGKSQNSPFYPEHKYILKITTNGTAAPSAGGFYAEHTAAKNKIFIERFVAKIPTGYTVACAYNSQGEGNSVSFITDRAGTGDWEEYAVLYRCGSSGTFAAGGHIYLSANSGYSNTSVTWYLAYVNNCDITDNPALAYYTALNNKDIIKGNNLYSRSFNTVNILPNGDGSDTNATLPSGWYWDKTDTAGNAKASIVQPINAYTSDFGGKIKINPHCRYKISMWIKCKSDMSSFLVAIRPYTTLSDGSYHELNCPLVIYNSGTKTTLTAELKSGDTQMTVNNNTNWKAASYSKVGFRKNTYLSSYNDLDLSNPVSHPSPGADGAIAGIEGSNIVKFRTAYTGPNRPSGTVVVESREGGHFPYPITKSSLPTDNTWKYVEGYFGKEGVSWDGASASVSWEGLPAATTHINLLLNYYRNTSSEAIKYADIKIEELGTLDGERHLNTVQFKKFI